MKLRHLALAALLALGLPAACGDTGVVGGDCRDGLTRCDGACVSLASDARNCGACGRTCDEGQACTAGVCGSNDAGDGSAGDGSAGDGSAGDGSAGDGSAGDGSAGDGSAGDGSAGDGSAGDGSAGDGSAGDGSAGDGSAGDGSTGDGSTGDGSTGDGSIMCPPPLVLCANACVDLDSDPLNCGSCGRFCPSGICEAGHCLGATAGHIALLCMSFEQNFQSSPQTTLLGNAVFLPVASPVRILTYGEYASNATRTRVNQALGWYASAKGRTFTLTAATSSADVQTRLAGFDYEVFLVYDEEAAPAGALGALGTAWASTLSDFLARGGVIVVTSGGGGRGEMSGLITSAGLLPVSAQRAATGTVLYNRAPADALGVNVLSPFLASRTSCTFETTATPSASTVFVVTDHAADGGVDSPAVIHRIP